MVELTTLGNFKIKYNGTELTKTDFNSEMLVRLMVYMIIHRDGPVDSKAIAAELWSDEHIKNPIGALKNLFYRLRTFLKVYYPEVDFFESSRGSYCWNEEIECFVDVEKLANCVSQAESNADESVIEEYLRQAIEIYAGEFLCDIANSEWGTLMKTYFHAMYIRSVKTLCEIYLQNQQYEKMYNVCLDAMNYDRLEEAIYYYTIMFHIHSNDLRMALSVYENATRILKKELGVIHLELLEKAYEELVLLGNGREKTSIKSLKESLVKTDLMGAYTCGFAVFKDMYNVCARRRHSIGYGGTLLLFTVNLDFKPENGKVESYKAKRIMNAFSESLVRSLRLGDVVSRYSDYQYVVMLYECPIEAAGNPVERVKKKFMEYYPQYSAAMIKCEVAKIDQNILL